MQRHARVRRAHGHHRVLHIGLLSGRHKEGVVHHSLLLGHEGFDGLVVLHHEGGLVKAILLVLKQLPEVDHEAPGVRAQRLQSLKEDGADLLLDISL